MNLISSIKMSLDNIIFAFLPWQAQLLISFGLFIALLCVLALWLMKSLNRLPDIAELHGNHTIDVKDEMGRSYKLDVHIEDVHGDEEHFEGDLRGTLTNLVLDHDDETFHCDVTFDDVPSAEPLTMVGHLIGGARITGEPSAQSEIDGTFKLPHNSDMVEQKLTWYWTRTSMPGYAAFSAEQDRRSDFFIGSHDSIYHCLGCPPQSDARTHSRESAG
eukprot:gnl/MRDRNA2_/MRDRNA2_18920_c0_seq1.p1 gnl/MRDRNA2_/MRDRNA2_18920_c0~~gnl/MRDRNA2_/MRDRNA2_18920_c0_seq1.p1  ORF type:complete len:217 (+),score=31.14 gnl/MRDRNA2_/MRDRNA2_18920_c0_seq1:82-732(+)